MPAKKSDKTLESVQISQRAAQRLVGDPEIRDAFDELEDAYRGLWEKTTPVETEKRELAYFAFKAVKDVRAILDRRAKSAHVRDIKAQRGKPDADA